MSESAFPTHQQTRQDGEVLQWGEPGMSLRDYFAAAALPGLLALVVPSSPKRSPIDEDIRRSDQVAKAAYHLADDMLSVRDGKPTQMDVALAKYRADLAAAGVS